MIHHQALELIKDLKTLSFLQHDKKRCSYAFSCKITKEKVNSGRIVFILRKMKIHELLQIFHFVTPHILITKWITSVYLPKMTFFISFDDNYIKIYCEKTEGFRTRIIVEAIFWEKGNEENYKKRQYIADSKKSEDYADLVYPEFNKYLNYRHCQVRYQKGIEEYNVYIRSVRKEKFPPNFSEEMKNYCFIMLARYQEDLAKNDPERFEENLKILDTSLSKYIEKGLRLNWLQVNKNNFTVYVC
jgi:hypothetical protein